tara:strand:- start:869 stop:1219 length:351 start_codon:yes stop_codon:yes gene_type:complete
MELTIYTNEYDTADTIRNFMDFYYNLQMEHLASDLLRKGLSPKQISDAVTLAVKIANTAGIETQKHFKLIYSAIHQEIIQDCKLSHLGYGLVLMNANPDLKVVGDFQVRVLNEFFK